MPSRPFPPNPETSAFARTKVLFLALIISSSVVVLLAVFYLLYHFYYSLLNRTRTIPFDSSAPLKIQRFPYKELKSATNDFAEANVLGKGGSGTVFRGLLRDGKLIAIKRLDSVSLETEREFQNELQILGGLRSPFLVTLLGYCVEKNKRMLVYEYMPNRSLQESIFGESLSNVLSWDRRYAIVLDVARALEFLHLGCDPPVIHGDVKPSNVLLDSDFRAKVSDFGLSRMKVEEGEFAVDLFSQELGCCKSQELSGVVGTPVEAVDSPKEVDFALALRASSSSRNIKAVKALNLNPVIQNGNIEGRVEFVKEVEIGSEDWNSKFVPYEESKEANSNGSSWGKDWWWRQDGSGELCSKDYVQEWIGSQICESAAAPDWSDMNLKLTEDAAEPHRLQKVDTDKDKDVGKKKHRKMQEWWKEERVAETRRERGSKLRTFKTKWKKGFKLPRYDLGRRFPKRNQNLGGEMEDADGEFSFRRGWRKKKKGGSNGGSDMWSGDLFSRELSSTTSMRGTLCYVAPEYGGCGGYLMEKADVYSFGVLILVIVSGRRPLHVLASPMKLEKANLVSWCRHLAQAGDVLELVDERLKGEGEYYSKEQAALCINVALNCLQKMPELRPDIGDVVRILKGEMDLPPLPFEFSHSPPSKKKHKASVAE